MLTMRRPPAGLGEMGTRLMKDEEFAFALHESLVTRVATLLAVR